MFINLNFSKKDSKFILLGKVFKHIDSKKAQKIYSRNGIKNTKLMSISIKLVFLSMFYQYDLSKVVNELKKNKRLKKFLKIEGKSPDPEQIYEYLSRYSPEQYANITNSIIRTVDRRNKRKYSTYIVDATPVACDINYIRKHVTQEQLEKLKLKWGYSTTKGHYIGFKVTMMLNKDTLCPVCIIINPGAPHDSTLFEPILQEAKRRRIIKNKDRILFDKGYYSYENYQIGINKFKIVPVIFPKSNFNLKKLADQLSYPLDVFKQNKNIHYMKKLLQHLKHILIEKLKNWENLKPVRGIIEDFFKVSKQAFGMGEFHNYTTKSITKNIYLCILLTTLVIKTGFKTKTQLQQLAEGNIDSKPKKEHKKKKNKNKKDKKEEKIVPHKSNQQKLQIKLKKAQTTLKKYLNI